MDWNIVDGRPIWIQLTELLTQNIATGQYPSGSRIPPVRELALEAGVNPNTMQRALSQLESDGLVVTNRTAGRTVTEDCDVLDGLRHRLANDKITQYLSQMAALGFTPQQAIEALSKREE